VCGEARLVVDLVWPVRAKVLERLATENQSVLGRQVLVLEREEIVVPLIPRIEPVVHELDDAVARHVQGDDDLACA